jgi:hypothetical protein
MQAVRNSYIEAIKGKIFDQYSGFKTRRYNTNSYLQLGSDLGVLGLGGAGSVVADTGLKSILAAASTALTGATSSYDKEILNQQGTLAIIASMDAERSKAITVLAAGENQGITQYTMERALVDLRSLYAAGSIISGLQAIQGVAATVSDYQNSQTQILKGTVPAPSTPTSPGSSH